MTRSHPRVTVLTASAPGAIALVLVRGEGAIELLRPLTGEPWFPHGTMRYVDLAGIDRGMAVALRADWVELMPHGGPRVLSRLVERLVEMGAVYDAAPLPRDIYPEADSEIEADMLAAMARAASPAAIDLLAAQPEAWRRLLAQKPDLSEGPDLFARDASRSGPSERSGFPERADVILARSRVLDRLVTPPTIVVIGRPNVGKSTLTNRMLGRAASVVADLPGTTRDWVAGLAELNMGGDGSDADALRRGVAVRWFDTPGLRESDDSIEMEAIRLARQVIAEADVLLVMRDDATDWPDAAALPREADLHVVNKCDRSTSRDREAIMISAATGAGLPQLQQTVLQVLGLGGPFAAAPWAFSPTLKRIVADRDVLSLRRYLANA